MRSGFDYDDADGSEFQSYEQTFADIKFQKLKIAEPSRQTKTKQPTKEKATSNDKEDIEKKLEKVFVDQLAQIIHNIKLCKIK